MSLTLAIVAVALAGLALLAMVREKRLRDQRRMEQHSITAEELHSLLVSHPETLLFDVRQPLDLLAAAQVIPGAKRIPPQEVLEKPSSIPKDEDVVVYCTCPSEKTSRAVLKRALTLHFSRIRFLKGGLAAWKAKGYPLEPYTEVFHLYTPTLSAR